MKNIDKSVLSAVSQTVGNGAISVGLECVKTLADPKSRVEREKNSQNFELEQGKHSLQVSRERADFTFKLMDRGESLESALTAGEDIYGSALHKKSLLARAKEASLGRGGLSSILLAGVVGGAVGVGYWAGTRRSSGVDSEAFQYLSAEGDINRLQDQEEDPFKAPAISYISES